MRWNLPITWYHRRCYRKSGYHEFEWSGCCVPVQVNPVQKCRSITGFETDLAMGPKELIGTLLVHNIQKPVTDKMGRKPDISRLPVTSKRAEWFERLIQKAVSHQYTSRWWRWSWSYACSIRSKEFVNFTNAAAVHAAVQLLNLLENQVRLRSNGSEVSGLLSRRTRSSDDHKPVA